jgi:hypothetical protein
MRVPSYQIYNILNIYSKWVSKNGTYSMEKFNGGTSRFDIPSTSADRYRKLIMQKVTGSIVSKITCLESNDKSSQKIAEKIQDYGGKNRNTDENNGNTFVFNAIDKNSKKTTNFLLIDKSSFLAK